MTAAPTARSCRPSRLMSAVWKRASTPEQMRITGLPVHPRFTEGLPDKAEARQTLGWDATLPTLLVVGGGEGMGPLYKTARAINSRQLKCQLVIIAGRNKLLKDKLESNHWNQPTHIYGFVNDMPRLMSAADVLVSKAGPSTICEACIAGLPMILYDAIPGQETGNVDYVVANDAGVFAPSPREVADAAQMWLAEGDKGLLKRSENAQPSGTPERRLGDRRGSLGVRSQAARRHQPPQSAQGCRQPFGAAHFAWSRVWGGARPSPIPVKRNPGRCADFVCTTPCSPHPC